VPQLSHDTTDDGFHEIQLSGKQLVFLFIVGTMAAVTIFLCGVYVGRGAPGARIEEAQAAPADVPTAPSPGAETGPPVTEPPTETATMDPCLLFAMRRTPTSVNAHGGRIPCW